MPIISQETWDNMPNDEKERIIENYNSINVGNHFNQGLRSAYKLLFGKEFFQPEVIAEKCVEPIKEYDKETQDYKWSQLSEDDRNYYQVLYAESNTRKVIKDCLIRAWGEHNLQPKPKIRTWEDVEKKYQYYNDQCESLCKHLYNDVIDDEKLRNKLIATYKIAKLIEFGYGGMVTEEEWKNEKSYKYVILPSLYEEDGFSFNDVLQYRDKQFIAFHTSDQREEFMSYPENVELVKQYNMIEWN